MTINIHVKIFKPWKDDKIKCLHRQNFPHSQYKLYCSSLVLIFYNTCNYVVLCAKPKFHLVCTSENKKINSVCQTTFHSLYVWESGDETIYNTHINRHSLCTSTLINTHLLIYSKQCQTHVDSNYVV